MTRRAVAALLLAILPAQTAPAVERWELEIVGPATLEHGELRFEGQTGRVVLESADSLFTPLARLVRNDSLISFELTASHRRFRGRVAGDRMTGAMLDADSSLFTWNAQRIAPGTRRWPVPPRVTIRQVEMGSDEPRVIIPGAWRALLPGDRRMQAEYDSLMHAAGLALWHGSDLQARSTQIQLGLDVPTRMAIRRTLEAIEPAAADDPRFRQLFRGTRGWRLDISDVALEFALRYKPSFRLEEAMGPIWKIAPGSGPVIDSAAVREAGWRFWSRFRKDSTVGRALDSLEDENPVAVLDARALLRGYDEAAAWWTDAVEWLMRHRWVETPRGPRSPEQLVQQFWNDSAVRLPAIRISHFGAPEAYPAPSMRPILARLVKPANAIAAEWLKDADPVEILAMWRAFDWGEPFRVVGRDGHWRYLSSPATEARTHAGGLLEMTDDRILIDPGVPPILAVAMVTHEWQHLILAGKRIRGSAPGLRESAEEVRFFEENAWLAEGAAEWATDRILAPAGHQAPLVLAISQSRRMAIRELTGDDPHVLGYRLVRAAADRAGDPALVQSRLIRLLHDLPAFARASGLAGKGPLPALVVVRPVNAAVIPEVTFVFDEGAALDVHRRLRVSLSPLEH